MELARRSLQDGMRSASALTSPGAVRDYLRLAISGREHEVFVCLWLDAQHRVIASEELFRGTLTQTSVYPREIVKAGLRANAAAVIFAQSHRKFPTYLILRTLFRRNLITYPQFYPLPLPRSEPWLLDRWPRHRRLAVVTWGPICCQKSFDWRASCGTTEECSRFGPWQRAWQLSAASSQSGPASTRRACFPHGSRPRRGGGGSSCLRYGLFIRSPIGCSSTKRQDWQSTSGPIDGTTGVPGGLRFVILAALCSNSARSITSGSGTLQANSYSRTVSGWHVLEGFLILFRCARCNRSTECSRPWMVSTSSFLPIPLIVKKLQSSSFSTSTASRWAPTRKRTARNVSAS